MILVTGATGNVGHHLVGMLADEGAKVRALTRDPAAARVPEGVEVARTDALAAALEGVESVFLNPAVFWTGPVELLRLAREAGVRRIVTLSSSSVVRTERPEADALAGHHVALENEVEAAGLEWVHVRPDVFAANTVRWAPQIRRDGVVRDAYGASQAAPVHEADIAAVAARALLTDELCGTGPVLTGPESVTRAEQVRLIGEALGRPLRFEELPEPEARAAMTGEGVPGRIADTLLGMAARSVGRPAEVSPEVERLTGRPPLSYARWARDRAADFR